MVYWMHRPFIVTDPISRLPLVLISATLEVWQMERIWLGANSKSLVHGLGAHIRHLNDIANGKCKVGGTF